MAVKDKGEIKAILDIQKMRNFMADLYYNEF